MRIHAPLHAVHLVSEKQPKYDRSNQARLTPRRVMAETPEQFIALREEL
jgi:hypothetical protein